MDKKYGLTIDPGVSTGICLFSWDDPDYLGGSYRQESVWQFAFGADGLREWIAAEGLKDRDGRVQIGWYRPVALNALVVEKFTPRSGGEFSLTTASIEPVRCEGVLTGLNLARYVNWQQPAAQYFMGGTSLKDRKKRSREFLKLNGIHVTGSMVGQPDADDAISAQLHAIAYLRGRRHLPTLAEMFDPEGE